MEDKFQVRHSEHGLFQGTFLGLGFWHPTSEQPEQGIYPFESYQEAQEFINLHPEEENKYTIESYDHALNTKLVTGCLVTSTADKEP